MKLIPRNEPQSMAKLQDRMNRLFENFFDGDHWPVAREGFVPAVDVVDTDEKLVVKVELPGVDPKDIDVSVHDNVLTIRGEKKSEREEKEKAWHLRESTYGSFSRSMTLPPSVNADKIEATCAAGVLTLSLPKSPTTKPRQISVKTK